MYVFTSLPLSFKTGLYNSTILPFSSSLLRRPMMTQCITAAVLFGTGDILAQQAVEGKGRNHDVSKSSTWGFCPFFFGQSPGSWLVGFRKNLNYNDVPISISKKFSFLTFFLLSLRELYDLHSTEVMVFFILIPKYIYFYTETESFIHRCSFWTSYDEMVPVFKSN